MSLKIKYNIKLLLSRPLWSSWHSITDADSIEIANGLIIVNKRPEVHVFPISNVLRYKFLIIRED